MKLPIIGPRLFLNNGKRNDRKCKLAQYTYRALRNRCEDLDASHSDGFCGFEDKARGQSTRDQKLARIISQYPENITEFHKTWVGFLLSVSAKLCACGGPSKSSLPLSISGSSTGSQLAHLTKGGCPPFSFRY